MALYGETLETGAGPYCEGGSGEDPEDLPPHERHYLTIEVLFSAAGFYVGSQCPFCGPYTRESGYFATRDEATQAMQSLEYGRKFTLQAE